MKKTAYSREGRTERPPDADDHEPDVRDDVPEVRDAHHDPLIGERVVREILGNGADPQQDRHGHEGREDR